MNEYLVTFYYSEQLLTSISFFVKGESEADIEEHLDKLFFVYVGIPKDYYKYLIIEV
jgi:hypothetical protein